LREAGWVKIDPPRALGTDERAMLALVLATEFTGVEELRGQAELALVVGHCECGCPSIDLSVPEDAPPARLTSRLVPSEGEVAHVGEEPPGQIILFADGGKLSYLEYVFFGEPPTGWPDPHRVRVVATI
jgi:hypothetical protein